MPQQTDFLRFLDTDEPADLGPRPRAGARARQELEPELDTVLQDSALSHDRQQAVRALILLWHDHLEAAHAIAQHIDTPDGAFVHAIMHRREPDYSNASYWFRRVGAHLAYPHIARRVGEFLQAESQAELHDRLIPKGAWAPLGLVTACENVTRGSSGERVLRKVQQIEFEELLKSLLVR